MNAIKVLRLFATLSLLIILINCGSDEAGKSNAISEYNSDVSSARDWFYSKKNDSTIEFMPYIKEISWEKSITSEGALGRIVEVPFTLKDNLSASGKEVKLYNDHHRFLFVKDEKQNYKLFYVQIFSDQKDFDIVDMDYNYYSIDDNFDGEVYVQELSTKKGSRIEFKNGGKVKPSLTSKMREQACVYYGYWYEDGHFEALYEVGCYGGGGDPDDYRDPAPGYGGGGGGSSGGSTDNSNLTKSQKIEKSIITDQLDPCTRAVYQKLISLQQGDIAIMIERFKMPSSIFNINMSTGEVQDNDPNVAAQTKRVKDSYSDVSIVFNQDYISGLGNDSPPTDLSVAAAMAHEVIHAYLISLAQEYDSCGESCLSDFPTVYEAYVNSEIKKNRNILPERHHEVIAGDYVYSIAETLEEFHTGSRGRPGFPQQIYIDIAWGGLIGTTIFNRTYPNDPSHKNYQDRQRILGRITAERLGSVYGVNTPVGKSCK